jgi:hypothetical protein
MTAPSLNKNWSDFASSIGANLSELKGTYFDHDNIVIIENDRATVKLIWGDQPQPGRGSHVTRQTDFIFKLNEFTATTLKVYPRDWFSKILGFLSADQQKTGDPELDKAYIFISNSDNLIKKISENFRHLRHQNEYLDFVILTKEITSQPSLVIQVNDLIVELKGLNFFYSLGLSLTSKINDRI